MRLIDLRPPRIALLLTLLAIVLHWSFGIWETLRFSWRWGGVIIGAAGISLTMWSWKLFKMRDVALCPKAKTASLILSGPYRFTRNPMYLGMVLMLAGLALYMGTLPFYLSTTAFFGILNHVFCPYEEKKLEGLFGMEYLQYLHRVRRWI